MNITYFEQKLEEAKQSSSDEVSVDVFELAKLIAYIELFGDDNK